MKLAFSTNAFTRFPLLDAIAAIGEAGFAGVEILADVPHAYPDQIVWSGIATLTGLPATAMPIGFSPEGLPIGMQIIGPYLEDRTPIAFAGLIERAFGGFVLPPGYA